MKKLNLKLSGVKEMLTKEQMKKVIGGHGYLYGYEGNCLITCYGGYNGPTYHPACGCHTGEYHRHCYDPILNTILLDWSCSGSDCPGIGVTTPWCGPYTN